MTATTTPPSLTITHDLHVDGRAVPGEGAEIAVTNPATEDVIARVGSATAEQVGMAVAAARAAFDDGRWSGLSHRDRSAALTRLADVLEAHRDELVALIVSEAGTPVTLSEGLQVGMPLTALRHWAELAAVDRTVQLGPHFQPTPSVSLVGYRPIGVVGAILAYNYPLSQIIAFKVGAALAAGCTSVVLPSLQTPLTALRFGELVAEADLPPGVVNVVVGGPDTGRALTADPRVDAVTFTGSIPVGKQIMRQSADTLKHVVLELGGKSPDVILPGTDLGAVVPAVHLRYCRNAGQGCASPTRVLVHETQYDEFVERSRAYWPSIRVGDPWDRNTVVGPLISAAHRDRVAGFVEEAVADGGEVLAGGAVPDVERGWYHEPTLIGGVPSQARVAQEEIFGPVGVVLPYRDVDDAVRLANDVVQGLAAVVFGPDQQQNLQVAARLRAGSVYVNGGGGFRPDAPFGGFRQSGIGRELGEWGLLEFLEPQHVQIAMEIPDPSRS